MALDEEIAQSLRNCNQTLVDVGKEIDVLAEKINGHSSVIGEQDKAHQAKTRANEPESTQRHLDRPVETKVEKSERKLQETENKHALEAQKDKLTAEKKTQDNLIKEGLIKDNTKKDDSGERVAQFEATQDKNNPELAAFNKIKESFDAVKLQLQVVLTKLPKKTGR